MSGVPASEEVTELDAKQAVAVEIVRQVKALAPLTDDVPDIWQRYWDVVNEVGAFADEDIASLGITTAQLGGCVTLLENIKKMMNNEAVTANTYRITINGVRHLSI